MTANEFVKKWETSINYLGLRSVGINVVWRNIEQDSKVEEYNSEDGWNRIYNYIVPWFKRPKTFKEIFENNDSDYRAIVLEEIKNGKIQRVSTQGLADPIFCAFADSLGRITMLGDGNHRFLNCNFLISLGMNFDTVIKNARLDIIYLDNFNDVLEPQKIWGVEYKLT